MVNLEKNKAVAIIIINWNNYPDTIDCIRSLENLKYNNFHVFLVDNNSRDNSFEKIIRDYKNNSINIPIKFLQTEDNLGFAGANNLAIENANKEGFNYFWLLNNDTVVTSLSLNSLIEEISKEESIGIVGSKIFYYGTNKLWFAGGKINKKFGKIKHLKMNIEDDDQSEYAKEVDYITGCSLLFKKELLDSIGYMNQDYFLYYEETEWSIRAKQKGWKIKFVNHSIIYHKVSISSGGECNIAPYVAYYNIRNPLIMVSRTQLKISLILTFIYVLWKSFKLHVKIFVKHQDRKIERNWYIIKGIRDGLMINTGKHPDYKKSEK